MLMFVKILQNCEFGDKVVLYLPDTQPQHVSVINGFTFTSLLQDIILQRVTAVCSLFQRDYTTRLPFKHSGFQRLNHS